MSYAGGATWTAYDAVASKVIEDAYQSYQRFAFIGKPAGAPGPYFIDFGNECDAELDARCSAGRQSLANVGAVRDGK